MNKKYWVLEMKNFEGTDKILYFANYEIAKANFEAISKKYSEYPDFELDEELSCFWYDEEYDCYPWIYLTEKDLPVIHEEVLF